MKQGNMEKLTKERKKTTERVSNGTDNNGYPFKSSGGFLVDRGDLLQKKNYWSKHQTLQ
jgi:membrane-bound lytic murein transglycosylase